MKEIVKKEKVTVPPIVTKNKVLSFDKHEIRTAYDEKKRKLYFCVPDVISALRDGHDSKDYTKKLRKRDPELNEKWEKLVRFISYQTDGGRQPIKFSDVAGITRIIQEVRSPRIEAFKKWATRKAESEQ